MLGLLTGVELPRRWAISSKLLPNKVLYGFGRPLQELCCPLLGVVWLRSSLRFSAFPYCARFRCRSLAPLRGIPTAHQVPGNWGPFFGTLDKFGMLLWIAAPYATICYGFRDKLSQLLLFASAIVTTIIFYWWIPAVASLAFALGIGVLIFSVAGAKRRRALFAVGVALAFGFVGVRLSSYLHWVSEVYIYTYPWTHYVTVCLEFLVVAIQTAACGWTHRFVLGGVQREPEIESTA